MRILIAGWFSFEKMGVTAGDVMACDVLCSWLRKADIPFDVAFAPPFQGGVRWQNADPASYSHVCFVCGPFGNGWPISEFLDHFNGIKLIGLNLSLLQSRDEWDPFTICYERDSSSSQRPDITFGANFPKVPVVGIILAHKQKEYGARSLHPRVDEAISAFVARHRMVPIYIDTCLEDNQGGLTSASEVESLIAKMDACITTRLHGLVLSIKNSVPAVAIDPIAGGAKVSSQAKAISWPVIISAEDLSENVLEKAFEYCLTTGARLEATRCANNSKKIIDELGEELIMKLKLDQ